MILKRIAIVSILFQLNDVQGDEDRMTNAIQHLSREELLSPKQFEKLSELKNIDLSTITNIINDTGMSHVKKEVAAILEELLRQRGKRYIVIYLTFNL